MNETVIPTQFLFIVRIWFVGDQTSKPWRGSVECVSSGQKLYFTSVGDLNDFITLQVSASTTAQMKGNPE